MHQAPSHPDTEHREDTTFGDPTPASTAYVGLIGVLIFLLVIIYLQALYYSSEEAQRVEKIVNEPSRAFNTMVEAQRGYLSATAYHHDYADGLGRVTIPVEGPGGAIEKLLAQWPNMPPEHNPPQPPSTEETTEELPANNEEGNP